MDDCQATYNKRWQNQSFLSVNVFTFVGSRPPQHSWPAAATPNHDEMLSFGWMIDYDLANTFHQSSQVLSSLWGSSPELVSNQTVIQHGFLVVNTFLQLDFIIAMIHIFTCQICILGSVVRALRFVSERLPVLIQTVCFCSACFCSSGKGAPKLFKSSEPKPSLSQSHH
jgi:hypothetical protein